MVHIVPRNVGNVEHEVYIQYYYVGLDKIAEPDNVVNSNTDGNTHDNTDNVDDPVCNSRR